MYCKNCGAALQNGAFVCTQCGVPVGSGNAYCPNCGQPTDPNAMVCTHCGVNLNAGAANNAYAYGAPNAANPPKSSLVAGLLGIFLGSLGIHNFYLGYTQKAIIQLLLTLIGWILCGLGPAVAAIWGLVEGIQILTGSINVDGHGNPIKRDS
ncbi:MAG TPA: TM2 domain-containing protein [Candidatus Onthovicinus excrementipullorum]|nr:TM2 domain-containing protein [Candidatus Onthovicinus excrementipullorum]